MENRALSLKEFTVQYAISLPTVYNMIRTGRLRAVKLGRRTVLLPSDVQAWEATLPAFHESAPQGRARPRVARLAQPSPTTTQT
jgi:excisionase family DNA binding protein